MDYEPMCRYQAPDMARRDTMPPFLLHESTVHEMPRSLEVLLESLGAEDDGSINDADLLVVLIHLLIVETGFTPVDAPDENNNESEAMVQHLDPGFSMRRVSACSRMPQGWRKLEQKSRVVYSITYTLLPFEQYHCRLIALPLAGALIANFIVSNVGSKAVCISLYPHRYVTPSEDGNPSATRFQRLPELSMRVKNKLTSPLRSAILLRERVPHASLAGLPLELQLSIAELLDGPDVARLGATCRALYPLAHEPEVWRRLALRDFTVDSEPDDWFTFYRRKYNERKTRRFTHRYDLNVPDILIDPNITTIQHHRLINPSTCPNGFDSRFCPEYL